MQYEGTAYGGFARQKNAPSIQAELETALSQTLERAMRVVGAGRTDAGVHAVGQVVSFTTTSALKLPALQRALNARLPDDIAVVEVDEAPHGFHARNSAVGRWYRYSIWRGAVRNVWWRRFSYHVRSPLDLSAMRQASSLLVGTHDFRAFASGGIAQASGRRGTVRKIYRADWTETQDFLYFDVRADGFLRQMVRGIVGTLLWVGRGKLSPNRVGELLVGADRAEAGPNAAAHGLTLMHVEYAGAEQLLLAAAPKAAGLWPVG